MVFKNKEMEKAAAEFIKELEGTEKQAFAQKPQEIGICISDFITMIHARNKKN